MVFLTSGVRKCRIDFMIPCESKVRLARVVYMDRSVICISIVSITNVWHPSSNHALKYEKFFTLAVTQSEAMERFKYNNQNNFTAEQVEWRISVLHLLDQLLNQPEEPAVVE